MKKALKWILISYVCVTIGVIIWQEYSSEKMVGELSWSQSPSVSIAYFFGTKRCSMCENMETWSREVSLSLGSVTFKTVGWQDDLNKNYVDHYNLLGNALIISFADKGREIVSKDLIDIWDVAHDEVKYKEYILTEFKKFLARPALAGTIVKGIPAAGKALLPVTAAARTDLSATVKADLPVAAKKIPATKGEN